MKRLFWWRCYARRLYHESRPSNFTLWDQITARNYRQGSAYEPQGH